MRSASKLLLTLIPKASRDWSRKPFRTGLSYSAAFAAPPPNDGQVSTGVVCSNWLLRVVLLRTTGFRLVLYRGRSELRLQPPNDTTVTFSVRINYSLRV
jgi:hypothetical protein